MRFMTFMRGTSGRVLRAGAGVAIILTGLLAVGGTPGALIAALGLVPLAAGGLNFCLLGPLLGAGPDGRARGGAAGG